TLLGQNVNSYRGAFSKGVASSADGAAVGKGATVGATASGTPVGVTGGAYADGVPVSITADVSANGTPVSATATGDASANGVHVGSTADASANHALVGQAADVSANNADTINFPQLLKLMLSHIEKTKSPIRWIRFESSNPKDFSDELIETIAQSAKRAEENPESPTICRGLHIAVQHGSSRILKLMNRRYTREAYLELVKKIREKIPGIQLSTDIMLGFPGESEEDFEEAYSLMKEVRYESAFMYYFNPREGTPAAKMDGQIDLETKKERLQKIIDLQLKITTDVMQERVGKTITVLADIISRDDKTELLGKTEQNERVAFKGKPSLIGHFVKVHLDSLNGNTFRGTLIE
ncbi:MAG: radical SAM protein, partial [Treponema sp.]|nr:radical SAM protein [Treponema sp.]